MNHSAIGVIAVGAPCSEARKRTNREAFYATYTEELARAVREYPTEYAWPVSDVPVVAGRMIAAFERNSYNKDSRAIKATCKRLGLKHTRRDINAFLAGE